MAFTQTEAVMRPAAQTLDTSSVIPVSQVVTRQRIWIAIDFPELALEVLPADLNTVVVVTKTSHRGTVVYQSSACARSAGIIPGLSVDAAMALCPNLHSYPRDISAESMRLQELGRWAGNYTPLISLESPTSIVFEVSGSVKLFGGCQTLCQRLHEGLRAFGWRYYLAVTPTPQASLLLAMSGCEKVVMNKADLRTTLGPLPATKLRLGSKLNQQLQNLGISHLYELWRLPRAGLARRLGPDLVRQIDCLLGAHPDPREIQCMPSTFEACLDFDAEIDNVEQIIAATRTLLIQLSDFLIRNDVLTTMINLFLGHVDKVVTHIKIGMRYGSRDPKYFELLIHEHLQRLSVINYVRDLRLTCVDIHPSQASSQDLFAKTNAKDWRQSLDELEARLGKHCLWTPYLAADHRPERGWRSADSKFNGTLVRPRPMWLLKEPRRLHQSNGGLWHIGSLTLIEGPERIENGWWDGNDQCRDYYKATNPVGHQLWIFRDLYQQDGWYLHGLFG